MHVPRKLSAILLFAIFLGSASYAKTFDVCVIGAGIAGLTAGYRLARQGSSVVVLEKSHRAGGRIETKHWPSGVYSEIGAEDILDNETDAIALVNEIGLELVENPSEGEAYFFEGRMARQKSQDDNVAQLLDQSEQADLRHVEREVRESVGHLTFPLIESHGAPLDLISADTWVRSIVTPKNAERLLRFLNMQLLVEMGAELKQTSALYMAQSFYDKLEGRWLAIEGGNDRLTKALSQRLGPHLRLAAKVDQIKFTSSHYQIFYRSHGREEIISAKRIVFAIPPAEIRKIRFDPSLPLEKVEAFQNVLWGSFLTLQFEFGRNALTDLFGAHHWSMVTDQSLATLIHATIRQNKSQNVLIAFATGDVARELSQLSHSRLCEFALQQLSNLAPGLDMKVLSGSALSNFWSEALPIFSPRYLHDIQPRLIEPVNNIFFAGDYTEQPGVDGAVRSAKRVVEQISQEEW
jgi:monoamine oxidase